MIKKISTKDAPAAIGPYSQAIVCGNLVYTSGQIPLDPQSGNMVEGDICKQAALVVELLGGGEAGDFNGTIAAAHILTVFLGKICCFFDHGNDLLK